MTSTSISKVGGMVIVTQVIPQDETSIALQAPNDLLKAPTPQAAPPPPPTPPTKVDDMTAVFLRGEPQGLGLVQICVGLLLMVFSLSAIFSPILYVHAPFGVAIAFVVSGSLTVAASRTSSVRLVWASLVSGVFSALISVALLGYACWLLAGPPPTYLLCGDDSSYTCRGNLWTLDIIVMGLRGLVLVFLVLQVCVVISVCVFSGRAVRRSDRYTPIMVVVDDDSDVNLLGTEGKNTFTSPAVSP